MKIAVCPSCAEEILTSDVTDVFQSGQAVSMRFVHGCGADGSVQVTWKRYRELAREHASSQRRVPESERIGRLVQGMRIELDAVETVHDLLLVWEDQERWAPWTVRKELA